MTAPRKRIGRPPRADRAATERIEIRATVPERRLWTAAAERDGISLSEWMRARLNASAGAAR